MDITEWLQWFLKCLNRAVTTTDTTLAEVVRKAKFWERPATKTINDRQKVMLNKILDEFERKVTFGKRAMMTKVSQDTAMRDVQDLVDRGLLAKEPAGGRSISYVLVEE